MIRCSNLSQIYQSFLFGLVYFVIWLKTLFTTIPGKYSPMLLFGSLIVLAFDFRSMIYLTNFCVWVKGQALLFSIHTISCSKIIPPCNYSGTFDVNQENIHLWVYLQILCSVPVVYLSILAPKVLCVNYSSFVVNVEIRWLSLPTLRNSNFFIKNFFIKIS